VIERLIGILEADVHPSALVVGDLMLDKYVWGHVKRTSQEAPVPVLEVTDEEVRPGGAGSVMNNLARLGATVEACSIVGDDPDGNEVRERLESLGVSTTGVIEDPGRRTTVKVRMMGQVQSARRAVQQLLRTDYEATAPLSAEMEARVLEYVTKELPKFDVVVVSDYDKGLLTTPLVESIAQLGREAGVPVIVDPSLVEDYSRYRGAAAVTPNRYEAEIATGVHITGPESLVEAGQKLVETLALDCVVITIDKDGMFLYGRDGDHEQIPTVPQDVYDVTGAGDMVVSALSFVVGSGHGFREAIHIANVAAGIEVGKLGVVPVSRQEIISDLVERTRSPLAKVRPISQLLPELNERRRRGARVAFTNGCFDLLHVGHIECIKYCRSKGDLLVVGVNSDSSVRRLKGPSRPILSQHERAAMLAALDEVDYIVIFDDQSVGPLIEQVRPDVLVKGGDVGTDGVVGRETVESYGGTVLLAPIIEGISTTDIVARVLERYKQQVPGVAAGGDE